MLRAESRRVDSHCDQVGKGPDSSGAPNFESIVDPVPYLCAEVNSSLMDEGSRRMTRSVVDGVIAVGCGRETTCDPQRAHR